MLQTLKTKKTKIFSVGPIFFCRTIYFPCKGHYCKVEINPSKTLNTASQKSAGAKVNGEEFGPKIFINF